MTTIEDISVYFPKEKEKISQIKIETKQEKAVPLDYKFLEDTLELSLPLESRQNEDGTRYYYITLTNEQYKKINKNTKLIISVGGYKNCLFCTDVDSDSGRYTFSTGFLKQGTSYVSIDITVLGAGEAKIETIPLEFPTYTPDVIKKSIGNGVDTSFIFNIEDGNYNRITDFYVCDANGEEVYPKIKKSDSNITIVFAKPPKTNEYFLYYCLGTLKEE